MKLEFNFGNSVISLPLAVSSSLVRATELDLRVLLYISSDATYRDNFDSAKLSNLLNAPAHDIDASVAFWRGTGIIKVSGKGAKVSHPAPEKENKEDQNKETNVRIIHNDDLPHYTGEELDRLFGDRKSLRSLVDECQHIYGKMFGPAEINKIVALSDYLHLSDEHILLIFSFCKGKDKASVHYAYKVGFELYDQGIDDAAKFEEYIRTEEERHSFENTMRDALGIGSRKLSSKEKAFFEEWKTFGFAPDIITRAYDITVDSTGKPSLPYMNRILSGWHDKGVMSLEDIERITQDFKRERGGAGENSSFDADEFFRIALEHSYSKNKTGNKAE